MLATGTRFGSYEIAAPLGAGGMGEVYRARDTTLDREVAIKVLPESFAADGPRIVRFEREAKTLAALNHPNIAQIYGLEKANGAQALVMELVEGRTLAERIADGAIPPDEALSIATQIAHALEAAHGNGIVHRDLKPANIKVRADGAVKVLDFGIAKAVESPITSSGRPAPSLTTPAMTQAGIILGTAAYMSPEQARGKPVDERADIWAFGCVLYEMLTGQPAFGGEDVTIILARVLERSADMSALPGAVGANVRQTIELCLQKDPRWRIADIRDVRLALAGAFASAERPGARASAQPLWSRSLPWVATVIATGTLVGIAAWSLWPVPVSQGVARFVYSIPAGQRFRNVGRPVVAISPNGKHVAYNTLQGLYVRSLDSLEARLLPGTGSPREATSDYEEILNTPFFSPDGESVAYFDFIDSRLKRIALGGDTPVVIADDLSTALGASWGRDGRILFGQGDGIYAVAATGGTPELLIPTDDGQAFGPTLLPDGDSVLYTLTTSQWGWAEAQVVVESLATRKRTVLIDGAGDARYLPTGHLVYAQGDGLFAVAFDPETLTISGGAVPIVRGVMRAVGNFTPTANYGVAEDGTLVYVNGAAQTPRHEIVWVDRQGNEEATDIPARGYHYAQLSPDGTRVALDARDDQNDIWIWDLERTLLQRLTVDLGLNRGPVWSRDGRRVAFSRQIGAVEDIYWQAADGAGDSVQLTQGDAPAYMATDLGAEDTVLLYMTVITPRDIWMVPVAGPPTAAAPLLASPADEFNATLSSDGRWLAYQSDESGRYEVYVRPFPDVNSGRVQVSTGGGTRPLWRRDGRELFYYVEMGPAEGGVMAVPMETEPALRAGVLALLFRGGYLAPNTGRQIYDVSEDGQRFLMLKNGAETSAVSPEIVVVLNWTEELERLVPRD
jgi:serine/threonine-protein kinase